MGESWNAKRLMTKHPHLDPLSKKPVEIDIDAPLIGAMQRMIDYRVHHLPVSENGKFAGILSDRDIKLAIATHGKAAAGVVISSQDEGITVRHIYQKKAYTVSPEASVKQVAQAMADHHYGCVPVLENGVCVGMITTTDICRLVTEIFE